MFLDQIHSAGAMPALEMTIRYAGQRQRLIAHNIANLETPDFRPVDVTPAAFQSMLGEAIEKRRGGRTAGVHGNLEWGATGGSSR